MQVTTMEANIKPLSKEVTVMTMEDMDSHSSTAKQVITAPQNGQKRFLEVGLVNMRDTEKTKNVPEPSQAKEQFAIGAKVNS